MRSVNCGMLTIRAYSVVLGMNESATMDDLFNNVSTSDNNDIHYTSGAEVRKVLSTMCSNKAGDCYGLHAENYKLAGDLYYSFLALLF